MTRYEMTFPMREGPTRQIVLTADDLNIMLKSWSDLVEDGKLPPGLDVHVRTLDPLDERQPASLRAFIGLLSGRKFEVVHGSLN